MEKEVASMYSNKVNITLNLSESVLTFLEIQPIFNEKDEITGSDIAKKSTVFMSYGAFKAFVNVANDLLKKVEDGQKETKK